jgi:hypothetical protein
MGKLKLFLSLLCVALIFTLPSSNNVAYGADDYTTDFGKVNADSTTVLNATVGSYVFTCEVTGDYVIDLKGGAGATGSGTLPGSGGLGAQINCTIKLNKGDKLYIALTGTNGGGMADVRLNGTALSNRILVAGGGGTGGEGTSGTIRDYTGKTYYVSAPGANGQPGGTYIVKKQNSVETPYTDSSGAVASITYNSFVTTGPAGAAGSGSSYNWRGSGGRGGDGFAGGTETIGATQSFYGPCGGAGGGGGLSFVDVTAVKAFTHTNGANAGKATVQISIGQAKIMTYDEAVTMIQGLLGGASSNIPCFTVLQNKPFNLRLTAYPDIQDVTSGAIRVTNGEKTGIHIIEGTLTTAGWIYTDVGGKMIVFHVIEEPNSSNVTVVFN